MNLFRCSSLVVVSICLWTAALSAGDDPPASTSARHVRPDPPTPVAAADLEAAIQRGLKFLLAHQNKDGSWGSPALKGGVEIIAGIGSHHAYQVAVTAMTVSALIESGDQSQTVVQAIERGERYLIEQLPLVRRNDPMLIYNVWTHAYGIQALVRMDRRLLDDAPRRKLIRELM